MAVKSITPRAWQIWIPGYEGRYLWNFATQRVMSCVYPGATAPTNLHHGASNPGYTLKSTTDVLHGGKGKYFRHVDLANWLNPMNPRNKKPEAVVTTASDATSVAVSTNDDSTYIVTGAGLKPLAKFTGADALDGAIEYAKCHTISTQSNLQVYKLVAESKLPTSDDVKIARF